MKINILAAILICFYFTQINAQDVQNSRRMSQKMETSRIVGTTQIKIVYHSPTAQGRKIFGGIVPYDFVVDGKEYPWRAGSNNRTTIEFEHDVNVNGNKLAAGKYGLVVLVNENFWTFIFTDDFSWGSFQYTPESDVLRVKAKVETRMFQEWLSYNFVDPDSESIGIELRWEKVSVQLNIQLDVTRNILADLSQKEDKTPRDYTTMATETLLADPNQVGIALNYLEKALNNISEVEEKYRAEQLFSINILKADCLIKYGKVKEGEALKQRTIANSKGFNMYYYGLNTLIVKNDKKEAYRLLSDNIKDNPEQMSGYLAMGEYYLKKNNQVKVVENFKKAYECAPDNWKNYARYLYLQNKLILERE